MPLYTIRYQSGPLTQFALRRFCRWEWRCSLPGSYASQIFHQSTVKTLHSVQNWTGNTMVQVLCRYALQYLRYHQIFFEKVSISQKNYLWPLITESHIGLGSQNAPPITSIKKKPLVFLLSSKTLSFEARGGEGRIITTTTLLVMKTAVRGKGYKTKIYIVKWTISEHFLTTGP